MAEAITVSGPVSGTDKTTHLFHRRARAAVPGSGGGRHRRHPGPGHCERRQEHPGGNRFLPPDRRRRGEGVRRGQDPRLVLPTRGSAVRQRRAGLSPDRPAAAPVVRAGLPQRDPGRGHRPRCRPGEPARHHRHQRRIGSTHAVRPAVRRSDRCRAPGLQPRRRPGSRIPRTRRPTSPRSRSWWPDGSSTTTSPS